MVHARQIGNVSLCMCLHIVYLADTQIVTEYFEVVFTCGFVSFCIS